MTAPKVNYTLTTVAPGTNTPLSAVSFGKEFDLVLSTQDVRPNPNGDLIRGVFAAYIDVLFNSAIVKPRTYEVQSIFIPNTTPVEAKLYIRFGYYFVGPIPYNNRTSSTKSTTAKAIQNALNSHLGTNKVSVAFAYAAGGTIYNVTFVGYPDADVPLMACAPPQITVTEKYKGGSVSAFSTGLTYSSNYPNGKAGKPTDYGIHALGAFSGNFGGLGESLLEVVRVRMVAKARGQADFSLWLSDIEHPQYDTLVYGNLAANPPEESEVADDEIISNNCVLHVLV